jgi:hypothetical protein
MMKQECIEKFKSAGFRDNSRRIWQKDEAYFYPSWEIYEKYGFAVIDFYDALKEDSNLPVKVMEQISHYYWFDGGEAKAFSDSDIDELAQECAEDMFDVLRKENCIWFDEYCADFEEEFGASLFDELKLLSYEVLKHVRECEQNGVESSELDFVRHYIHERYRSSFNVFQTEEQLIKAREFFIEKNVELPCQGITRRLMEAGKITCSSNAFASEYGIPKGVRWMEPGDCFSEVLDRIGLDERGIWGACNYVTDLEGDSWCFEESSGELVLSKDDAQELVSVTNLTGNEVDFSDVLPTGEDFECAPEREQPESYSPRIAGYCLRLEV